MKTLFINLFVAMLLVSCKNETNSMTDKAEETTNLSLQGTWELVGFYNYVDNKVVDSFDTNEGYRQVKMYTPTKVMWSKHVPTDSTEWFGYGSYNIKDKHLIEVLDYGSKMMKRIIQEKKEFIYELDLEKNRFSQIELDEDGNRIYSENYKRIE